MHKEMKYLPGYHTASLVPGQDPSGKSETFCFKGHRQKDRGVRKSPDSRAWKTDAKRFTLVLLWVFVCTMSLDLDHSEWLFWF